MNDVPNDRQIEFSHVSKVYLQGARPTHALDDVTMQINEGEIVSVLGPSGCGKTSLLRIAAGLLAPSGGVVRIGSKSPEEYRTNDGIGFVFQKPVLFPWRTVMDNVLLPFEIKSESPKEQGEARAKHLMELLSLEGFENAYPRELSGGMLQRAAVARALVARPKLLFLDEPFSALDELTREQLWVDSLRMWLEEKPTILLVTHSVREAVFFGHRVLIMSSRPGHIREQVQIPLSPFRDQAVVESREFLESCELVRAKLAWPKGN